MFKPSPTPFILAAEGRHIATTIFLHGLGDQGDGWGSVFQHEARVPGMKYICPSSASRPVTLNMGMKMPAWYDLKGLSPDVPEDDEGIEAAKKLVHTIIDKEIAAGIPANRIVLGGFSMGGALALYAGITYPQKLAGIVSLSGFLIQRSKLPGNHHANLNTATLLCHGSDDPLVPLSYGQLTHTLLKTFMPNTQFKLYPGLGHSSSAAELNDLRNFLINNACMD
ncbi:unnamed protein product, partial [Mesorhabditis spiculigera]